MNCETEVGLDGRYRSKCAFPDLSDLTAAIVVVVILSLVLLAHTVAMMVSLFQRSGWCGRSPRLDFAARDDAEDPVL